MASSYAKKKKKKKNDGDWWSTTYGLKSLTIEGNADKGEAPMKNEQILYAN